MRNPFEGDYGYPAHQDDNPDQVAALHTQIAQLQAQLQAVREQARLLDDEFEECRAQLQAVSQENEQLRETHVDMQQCLEDKQAIAQLQAHNKELRDAFVKIRWLRGYENMPAVKQIVDAALTHTTEKPKP